MTTAGQRAVSKASRRILPLLFCMYIVAYLDRPNVTFAKLPMAADLGFSEAVFGLGAGLFFVGYFVLEIPGAIIVERWSAQTVDGAHSGHLGSVHGADRIRSDPAQFCCTRFLLGWRKR